MAIDIQISRKYPTFYNNGTPNCATVDPELFFPEKGRGQDREFQTARAICNRCDLTEACLDWALKHYELGIWGGTSERERKVIRREKGIKVEEIAS
jgi:WhiB family redox-sensing transcriptional regulator